MASITKEPNGRWRARYRDRKNGQHTKRFDRKIDAQRWLDEVTTELGTGAWADPRRSKVRIYAWVRSWLDSRIDLAETTKARLNGIVEGPIAAKWSDVPLADLEHADVQKWVGELLGAGSAPRSARKVVGVLSSACDAAMRDRRLASNPCAGVVFPRATTPRKVFLSPEQVEELAGEAGRRGGLIIYTLAYCGLRWGELAGMRVGDVDPLRLRMNVHTTVVDVDGKMIEKAPKDYESRSVPVPAFLMAMLVEQIGTRDSGERLFTSERGATLRNNNERRRWFDQAAEAIGEPDLTPHGLRHTAASIAIANGASVLAVQRMLGHSSATVTLDVYSQLFDTDLDVLGRTLDAVRAKTLASNLRPTAAVSNI